MKMQKGLLLIGTVVLSVLLTACGGQEKKEASSNDKIQVMTTFYPMYEFTKQVVGNKGEVELLIPAGTEPHDFEPSAKDLAKISDADVFVYNSPELETWTDNLTDTIDTKKTEIIQASKNITLMDGAEHDHEEAHDDHDAKEHEEDGHDHDLDPHVWLDPVLAIKEVETIRDQLSKKYPEDQATFEKNAASYIDELKTLDEDYQAGFKAAKNKTFVTQHAAFGYLAKQYGLTQEAIAGISPDQEPSPSRLSELKHYVDDHQVKVIYFEENASSKVAETLSKETSVKLKVLNPLESLTEKQIKNGEDYVSVMRENLDALKESIK
ncbi:metal ABC transporter substrate-binding protein [Enterococcus hulanensis]|uniref:Metal ABC transporter substrate-binding protein n=1 Tax=Enterococcus hulanensis TaxID=2559929 RepID=A0ABU3F4I3_9ENTE|nr:metal ABC transporter substrate-binding protein [Enterococcus hulanensis]MDT2601066.1 metal ABC transporter substrate-binding protein [Enterococcus hulanensis]MDT2610452.1 metal ABC transporter substrate-binding protein [Enterococcus hulanensis]MDT2617179.1 metal ABC transporter substrate-binding protein [Enterococcus hulanensis]MDT2628301.1 metal ABC transporter substrate-binding protein [Enterococcus hulanensis]MDT2655406.1 metal ABC transporter substrate-binding protein [Enterococcus hul